MSSACWTVWADADNIVSSRKKDGESASFRDSSSSTCTILTACKLCCKSSDSRSICKESTPPLLNLSISSATVFDESTRGSCNSCVRLGCSTIISSSLEKLAGIFGAVRTSPALIRVVGYLPLRLVVKSRWKTGSRVVTNACSWLLVHLSDTPHSKILCCQDLQLVNHSQTFLQICLWENKLLTNCTSTVLSSKLGSTKGLWMLLNPIRLLCFPFLDVFSLTIGKILPSAILAEFFVVLFKAFLGNRACRQSSRRVPQFTQAWWITHVNNLFKISCFKNRCVFQTYGCFLHKLQGNSCHKSVDCCQQLCRK